MVASSEVVVRVGQRWKEVDPRFDRIVQVIGVEGDFALIFTVNGNPATIDKRNARQAMLSRFNGKRGGYELLGGSMSKITVVVDLTAVGVESVVLTIDRDKSALAAHALLQAYQTFVGIHNDAVDAAANKGGSER